MQTISRPLQIVVWGALGLTVVAIGVGYVLKERWADNEAVGPDGVTVSYPERKGTLPVLFEVPDFALTNQTGQIVTRESLLGQVWLADIIFSRCAGPCPGMTRRMAEMQTAVSANSPVRFVTLTADPDFDTPTVLDAYARRYLATPGRWHFLTGTKKQIVDLAVGGLKFTATPKDELQRTDPNDLFIHATIFVAVDKRGRVRAVIESDDPAMKVKSLGIIQELLNEP